MKIPDSENVDMRTQGEFVSLRRGRRKQQVLPPPVAPTEKACAECGFLPSTCTCGWRGVGRCHPAGTAPPIELPPIELEVLPQPAPAEHYLEVGTSGTGEVIVNYPDDTGGGHIVFSVEQARGFAKVLMSLALDAEMERRHGL